MQKQRGRETTNRVYQGEYAHDISEYVEFNFDSWVKYHDIESYPKDSVKLGHWLGVVYSVGSAMTYWILKENGMIIPRSTVRPLTDEETRDPVEIKTRAKYDEMVATKFGE